ncbi:ABC transporter permease [Anaerobacillus sp. HL2]|nr:ABC transporter permease [Anaerobacillus sp. HL2]
MDIFVLRSFFISFIIQGFIIILFIVLLTPLYRYFIVENANSLFIIIVLLISKGWNLLAEWEEARLLYSNIRLYHKLFRFIVNVTLTYFVFAGAFIYFVMAVLFIKGLLLLYYQSIKKQHSLKWEYLIEVEDQMVMFFYRIANMFTDVPKIGTKVKRRRMLSSVSNLFPFNQESYVFLFTYLKSFIRKLMIILVFIFCWLVIVVIVWMFYVQVEFASIFIALLFLYMSALQLSTLWKHHELKLWFDLYPIDVAVRKSLLALLFLC